MRLKNQEKAQQLFEYTKKKTLKSLYIYKKKKPEKKPK